MRILIVTSWYPTNRNPESGTFFRDRAQILHKIGINIVVCSEIFYSSKKLFSVFFKQKIKFHIDELIPTYISEGVNYFPKLEKLKFKLYKKRLIKLVNNTIQNEGVPDVVFINSTLLAGVALADYLNDKKIPFIISEHLKEFLFPDSFSKFQRKIISHTYKLSSKIIATSSALKKTISYSFPKYKSKISIIPNPVDEDIFVKKQIIKKESCINIICVALLRPEKRIDLIIQSFYELLQSGRETKLTIVGDGPLKSKLINQIQELDISSSVKLKGYLSQKYIVQELHKNDFLVLASDMETFGVVLIEAQACGLPVVATDCGGPSDIISSDTGILVKPGSIQELTKGLIKMIDSINNYKSEIIRKKTIDQFGKHAYFDAIEGLVNNIISNSN